MYHVRLFPSISSNFDTRIRLVGVLTGKFFLVGVLIDKLLFTNPIKQNSRNSIIGYKKTSHVTTQNEQNEKMKNNNCVWAYQHQREVVMR